MLAVVAALLVAAPDAWDPAGGVCLSDAARFGVAPAVAALNRRMAIDHPARMRAEVAAWNHPDTAAAWERECARRYQAWDELDTALNYPDWPAGRRLAALVRLRGLIGDESYLAGEMPAPIPAYRVRP